MKDAAPLDIIVLVRGSGPDGAPQWAYALVPHERYKDFRAAEEKGDYDLAGYGRIAAHGLGDEPPEEVKRMMEEQYGANHMLEEQFGKFLQDAAKMKEERK